MQRRNARTVRPLVSVILFAATVCIRPLAAQSYISTEPIPNVDVVGGANLTKILNVGYSNLETWSRLLLDRCNVAGNVINALSVNGAISTVTPHNTRVQVEAGGFEAVTDPTYVFTLQDSGPGGASASDIGVLDNAMGYVLSQGGNVHFSPSNAKAYDFPLDYAVVTFRQHLTGLGAKAFFDYVGTVDPALWSGSLAGFTQIGDAMLFLQPATSKREFIDGLSAAAATYVGAAYQPLNNHGQPTTAKAGVSFPGNDWIAFPNGDQYLAQLGSTSPALINALATLRQRHLTAVGDLLSAIDGGTVGVYLKSRFRCPQ